MSDGGLPSSWLAGGLDVQGRNPHSRFVNGCCILPDTLSSFTSTGAEDWGADLDLQVSIFMFLAPSIALLTLFLRQKVTGVQTCVCVQLLQLCPTLLTLQTVAHQPPLCMGFFRQEYWSGFPCPPLEDLLNPGIKLASPTSPAGQVDSLPLSH